MSVHIFLGPTLPVRQARDHLVATYHPPAQQGDVLRLLAQEPGVIGIVDGYFERVPSVWHKEILVALSRGVRVFGAASMGALRAAELHTFGMVGVGRVFDSYRTGALEDDDEVAVTHGPAESEYVPFSEAMVNIRDGLEAAVSAKVISLEVAARLTAIAKELHYPDRSYRRILEIAHHEGTGAAEMDALTDFLAGYGPSLKQRDAVAMLDHIATVLAEPYVRRVVPWRVERTVFLAKLMNEVHSGTQMPIETTPEDRATVRIGETLDVLRKKVLLRLLARAEATRIGLDVTPGEVQDAAEDFRSQFGLMTAEATEAWLNTEGLTREAFFQLMRDACLLTKLEQHYGEEVEQGLAAQVRLSSARLWSFQWSPE